MKHIGRIMVLGLALLVPRLAWAGHVYINPASCSEHLGQSGAPAGAERVENVGLHENYVTYRFNNSENPTIACPFFMPADDTNGIAGPYAFTMVLHVRYSAPAGGTFVQMGGMMAANKVGVDYDHLIPQLSINNVMNTTAAILTHTTTITASAKEPAADGSGATCTLNSLGNPDPFTCANFETVLWVQRVNVGSAACLNTGQPYVCCTGAGTGCPNPNPNTGDVELLGIDLQY